MRGGSTAGSQRVSLGANGADDAGASLASVPFPTSFALSAVRLSLTSNPFSVVLGSLLALLSR